MPSNIHATMEVEQGIVNSSPTVHLASTASTSAPWWKRNQSNKILSLFVLVAVSVALGLALSHRESKVDRDVIPSQIIGGTEVIPNRYSYAVSLQDGWGHNCGGSLIASNVVLTAAHCRDVFWDPEKREYQPNIKAVAGRHDSEINAAIGSGESIPITNIVYHPNYDDVTMDNDFMLVFLETAFTASNIGLVKLNTDASLPFESQVLTSMGWGDTNVHVCRYQTSPVLKHVDLRVISNQQCVTAEGIYNGTFASYADEITDNMLCAWACQEDTCQGDSGGPLIIKGSDAASDVQVGVVSKGIDCASSSFPGVYSRVSEAYDWIKSVVCYYRPSEALMAGFDCPVGSTLMPTASPITYAPTFTTTSAPTKQCNEFITCADIGLEGMCCSAHGVSTISSRQIYGGVLITTCSLFRVI
jgi:secreted trypsin-like serine protease